MKITTRTVVLPLSVAATAWYGCRDAAGPAFVAPSFREEGDPRYYGSGDRALVWWITGPDEPGTIEGVVRVSENLSDTGADPAVWLTYEIHRAVSCVTYAREVSCEWEAVERGAGYIPPEGFTGSGTSRLVLETNTSAEANPGFTRENGAGGQVRLEWWTAGGGVTVAGRVMGFEVDSVSGSMSAREAASVEVRPASATVRVGDTLRLAGVVRDSAGHVLHDAPLAWTTSDGTVARVDQAGLVTVVGNGWATVTASSGGVRGAAAVRSRGRAAPRRGGRRAM